MGYISKKKKFHGRIIINENINTAVYIMLLQQIDVCLRRSEKNLTNALWLALQYLIFRDSCYMWLALHIFSVQYHSIDSLDMDIVCII